MTADGAGFDWSGAVHAALDDLAITQVAYVPDAGLSRLITLCAESARMTAVPLTTEEEGIALLAGAWLGGQRGVLMMQSSGLGNCVNMFSLARTCRFPLLMLVTMRGEPGESNPWQMPMGGMAADVLTLAEIAIERVEQGEAAATAVRALGDRIFAGSSAGAVLFAQGMLGFKTFQAVAQ